MGVRVLALAAAFLLAGAGAAFAWQGLIDRVLFAGASMALEERAPPPDAERIWVDAQGARLEGWLFAPPGQSGPAPALLYFHGNAELIDTNVVLARTYARLGYAVLLAEYRGYGRSTGRPSAARLPGDAVAFYDALRARPEVSQGRITVVGRSLGGAAAAAAAAERAACALVLESTFSSLGAMVREAGFSSLLASSHLDSRAALAAYNGPVLVMHGRTDEVIPFAHGQALRAAAQARQGGARTQFVPFPGGHNPMAPFPEIAAAVVRFLDGATACGPRAAAPR